MNRANEANRASDQNRQGLDQLRGVISNIDDYKLQTSVSVPFKFDKYSLTDDAKQDLDKLVGDVKSDKRFFVAVEGQEVVKISDGKCVGTRLVFSSIAFCKLL